MTNHTDTQSQALRVDTAWRRQLRVWLAEHDLSTPGDIAEAAARNLLHRDHGDAVYIAPPPGPAVIGFVVPTALHAAISDMVGNAAQKPLWNNGIRSIRDFYLIAIDLYITAADRHATQRS